MKTKIKFLTVLVLLVAFSVQVNATKFEVNKPESELKWKAQKVTGKHHGIIEFQDGFLAVENGKLSGGNVNVDMQTIKNIDIESEEWNSKLVGHLKSDDFFSVEKYPVSNLKITSVKHVSGKKHQMEGQLTIKGITNPVSFEADVDVNAKKLIAEGSFEVDRTLYDIKYRSGKFFESLGDNLIYDNFTLEFRLVANASETTAFSE